MYLYIELWNAKPAWVALTNAQRQDKLKQLLAEKDKNPITGVLPCSVRQVGDVTLFDGIAEEPVVIDTGVARPTGFRYLSAYFIPTHDLILKFEKRVEALGWWFDYFEQENAWGLMDVDATVADMVAGNTNPTPAPKPGPTPAPAPRGLVGRIRATEEEVHDVKAGVQQILQLLQARRP